MTNKYKLLLSMILASFALFSHQSIAAEKSKTADAMPQQCKKLFQATEQLIADAERQPGTHPQVNKIKNKLNQSKKQILEMELATQIKSCDHGLAKLTSLQQDENTIEQN
ncbi:MAG: DUF5339 domain-containing protein [Pasteurellaceae bacterium]|nr:DUF5339 domain-containing protein [Pasteurellaceae bacterium]